MKQADFDIRVFTPQDWDAVCAVYQLAAPAELLLTGGDESACRPMAAEESKVRFLEMNSALLACIGDRAVGFVAWRDRGEWHGSGYLSWLYVEPAHHRRGIGNRLLTRAMSHLGSEAWTLTRLGNDPAINLYRKHGMEIVKSRRVETGDHPHTELRLALPTSRKHDPAQPNFGA